MTLRQALARGAQVLAAAGLDDPRREAGLLLCATLGVGRDVLLASPARVIDEDQRRDFDGLIARRADREPAAYILGEREFWSLSFLVNRHSLIPRPDSETLIEAALDGIDNHAAPRRLLDFGAGSGCLLLALLSELDNADGIGVDISPPAIAVAAANAVRLGLGHRARFLCSNWGRALAGEFDLIIANPPYIDSGDMAALSPEITRYEPALALDAGTGGLDCYRALAPDLARLLAADGLAIIEIGQGQADAVAAIMVEHGLSEIQRRRDLAGIERCIVLHH